MGLQTFVKIGNISNLSDARYCAGMMADILGFNLEEGTEGFMSLDKFKEITEWVAGVAFCGEFKNAHINEIKLAIQNYPLDFIEIQDIEQLEELAESEIKIIFKINIESKADLVGLKQQYELAEGIAEKVIISSENDELFDPIQEEISRLNRSLPVLCGFGINEKTAASIVSDELFSGIELVGTPEERPGYKDYGLVMDVLEVIEED